MVVLTTAWSALRRTGGEAVSQVFIDALRAQGHRVTVIAYRRKGDGGDSHPDDVLVGERPIETEGAALRSLAWMGRAILTGLPYSAAKYASRAYRTAARNALRDPGLDLVIVDHAQAGWIVGRDAPPVPWVLLAHNVEHQLYAEHAARRSGVRRRVYAREAERVGALEGRLVSRAAGVWALTEDDADDLERTGSRGRPTTFDIPPGVVASEGHRPVTDVVMLGTWTWAANATGLDWFMTHVVPHLPTRLSVEVGGRGAERFRGRHASVVIRGPVDSAADFLSSGRVIAIPSREGSGVQIKTLDAIGSELPVVATTLAMRGVRSPPPTVQVADDPVEFAAALTTAATTARLDQDAAAARDWTTTRRVRFGLDLQEAVEAALRQGV
jgi:polysaccharide biosynthesis protein PslH